MSSAESKVPNLTNLILRAAERAKSQSIDSNLEIEQHADVEINNSPGELKKEKDPNSTTTTGSNLGEKQHNPGDKTIQNAEELVGNQAFKDLCKEISSRAISIHRNNTQSFFFSTAYLFSVNTGNGYKTALQILDELLSRTGLFVNPAPRSEYVLPEPNEPDIAIKLNNIIGTLDYAFSAPRIVSFDISSWLGHTGEQRFKNLLMQIFQKNTQCLIIFRVPYIREKLLRETTADLLDVISTRSVVFEPFSKEELRLIAERMIEPYGIHFSPDAMEDFDRRITKEKSNGYFYGIHTVKKVVGDFIREMELQGNSMHQSNIITGSVINRSEVPAIQKNEDPGFDGFADMIGMGHVEARLREVLYQIQFARSRGIGKPCMHMFFVGNPGTGKTTVARMLGNEMKRQGVLRIGKFFEHKGRDLCAEYVGQTTPKTVAICEQAYGSILFIDEAYSLAAGSGSNDYGKEAVDALIAEMENHYDDLVVIFAGYPDEMQNLLDLNPGMRSRVPYTIEFPNYTSEELYMIFAKMASEHFEHAPGFDEHAKSYFMNLPTEQLTSRAFGNARFVRNLYERVWGKATARCARSNNATIELTVDDFESAAREFNLI
jgi:hypothetical protein